MLYVGYEPGKIRIYPTNHNQAIHEICIKLGRQLDKTEWNRIIGANIPYKVTECE
jgi:hypothetical protein